MSSHDPFGGGDSDRTIMKPMPGGTPAAPTPPPPSGARPPEAASITITGGGDNPLLRAAAPLFALVPQLRVSVSHPDPLSLQAHVGQEILNFEATARQQAVPQESVLAARYALCTLLDETALSTPWGVESQWAGQTLLVRFHNEARGGEKFFQILERLLQDPGRNLHLLELFYVCLALGFEGQYRLNPRGQADLEQIRITVFETVRQFRGARERDLSLRWRGVEHKRPRLAQFVPLWVLGAVGAGICLLAYIGFLFSLNVQSDPVVGQIAGLARDAVPLETRAALPVVQQLTLSDVLSDDPYIGNAITGGLLQVEEAGSRAQVRLWGLFPSGQSSVSTDSQELIDRVAQGLNRFSGRIQVVGHTDDQPIRSLRFPSNWILSERRAEAVQANLANLVRVERLSAEGRADTQPLVANDSAVNRALNRRIEIALYYESQEL